MVHTPLIFSFMSNNSLINKNTQPNSEYILVIEDNSDLNLAICEILISYGYQVKSARNGVDGLKLIEQMTPDAILCDIMMPEMDGYTLLRHTRANPQLRTIPFIFLTARSSSTDQRKALNIGIEDYLVKPIEEEDLVLTIRNALRRRKDIENEVELQLETLRNQIVGALQHEFRTPLTFVLGYAEYLQDITDEDIELDELKLATSGILEGGYRLQKLIESFLLLAEVQNRNMKLDQVDTVRTGTIIEESIHDLRADALKAGLTFQIEEQNYDLLIQCEQELIIESIKRLGDNAIRYRRPESRHIYISVEQVADRYIGFIVRDEGIGIAQSTLQSLLRPFEQGNRTDRTEPGAGLSLALVHHIANLHGGTLEIESTPDSGSTFALWLPSSNRQDTDK